MGGNRIGAHKVDQIAPRSMDAEEENPFLVSKLQPPGLASPGRSTIHLPGEFDDYSPMSSPLTSALPLAPSSLQTPIRPKTRPGPSAAEIAHREARARMMDEDSNPLPRETRREGHAWT